MLCGSGRCGLWTKQDWLEFVVTSRAKSKIKHALKEEKYNEAENGKEIIKRRLNIKWSCDQGLKVNTITKELAYYMKKSGCTTVAIGVESSNNRILKNLKKGATIEQTTRAIKICKDAGLVVKAFFLIGSPGETFKDTLDNIKYFKKNKIDAPRFSILTPYPGTELWEFVEKNSQVTVLEVEGARIVVREVENGEK